MAKKKSRGGNKRGYGAVFLTVLLIGVYFYLAGTFSKTEEVVELLEESKIESVEIKGGGQETVLKKEGRVWFVIKEEKKIPADGEKVESLVAKVGMIKFDDLVSFNPEKLDLFGLGEEKYILKIGGEILEIGKMGPDWRSTYVKKEGSDEVFLVGGEFDSDLKGGVWERIFLTNIPIYQVKRIEIEEGGEKRTVSKEDEGWDELVLVLSHLSIEELVDEEKGERERGFLIEDEGGKIVEIEIGKDWASDNGVWFYKISPEDYQVLISF